MALDVWIQRRIPSSLCLSRIMNNCCQKANGSKYIRNVGEAGCRIKRLKTEEDNQESWEDVSSLTNHAIRLHFDLNRAACSGPVIPSVVFYTHRTRSNILAILVMKTMTKKSMVGTNPFWITHCNRKENALFESEILWVWVKKKGSLGKIASNTPVLPQSEQRFSFPALTRKGRQKRKDSSN